MKSKKLTVKQKLFADEYIKTGNATDAAIKAGYANEVSGRENLQKPTVKSYIDAKMKEIESHKIMDAAEALQILTRIARGEEKETVILATPKGVYESEKPPSNSDKMAAIREILKRYPVGKKEEAQLRSLIAKARTDEAKATIAERLGSEDNEQLDDILNKLVGETSNESRSASNTETDRSSK